MQRDMDIVRKIALATAALPYGETLDKLDGVADEVYVVHVIWMEEAGLIKATAQAGSGSSAMFAIVERLTWAGCEFSDAVRSDTVWSKAKSTLLKPSMSFTFDVLKDWLKTEIAQGLPTMRSLGQ
jgi:hypothetical protein